MDCLTFLSNLIDSLAWPLAVVIVAFMLRKQLPLIFENVKKFKAGSFEFERLEKDVLEAKEKAEVVANKFDEQDDETEESDEDVPEISNLERQVLEAITKSNYAMRSVTGVAKDTGLPRKTVNRTYTELIGKGLLGQTTNKSGKQRWYPTYLGRRTVASAS